MSANRCQLLADERGLIPGIRCRMADGHPGHCSFLAGDEGTPARDDRRSKAEKLAVCLQLMNMAEHFAAMGFGDRACELCAAARSELTSYLIIHQRALMREVLAYVQSQASEEA
jgi:hypothetical protein